MIWLFAVTLCSAHLLPESSHENEPDGHGHGTPAGSQHEAACGCDSFKSFPAQSFAVNLAKVPVPASLVVVFIPTAFLNPFSVEAATALRGILSTSPPERLSFAELVLQQCRQSQAPPLLA